MRVTARFLHRALARRNDESGATFVIVAIALVSLLGMVVLVVDVGGLLTMRKRMITAADSAALAAAQSCAKGNAIEAPLKADEFALTNQATATRLLYEETDCGERNSGAVKVKYHAPKELYFGQILGAPSSRPVSATAKAVWGPAMGTTPMPIEFPINGEGEIPCVHQEIGTECVYWYDQNADHGLANNSNWGFLNLRSWGVDANASCPNSGSSERAEWMNQEIFENVSLADGPKYACVDSGHSSSNWMAALQGQVGHIRHFPVNDPERMIRESGKEKYFIIGFAALRVDAVLKGNDPEAIGSAGSSGRCSGTHTFEENEIFSIDLLGCYPFAPDNITNLVLTSGSGSKKETVRLNADYTYDEATHEITWKRARTANVDISFDWSNDPTPGKCGYRPSDPNAICLVTSWQGAQVGGYPPGSGGDFDGGLRAVRLDE